MVDFADPANETAAAMMDASSCGCSTTGSCRVRGVPADRGDHLLAGAQVPDRAARPHPARRRPLRSRHSAHKDREGHRHRPGHYRPRVGRAEGAEHAAAEMVAVCALRDHRLVGGLVRALSVGARRYRLLPRCAGLFAAHGGGRRGECGRSAACRHDGPIKALSFAEIRKDPQLCRRRRHGRAHRIRQQLPAVPWRWRRRTAGLSGTRGRCMDLGRHAGGHPADHHLRDP